MRVLGLACLGGSVGREGMSQSQEMIGILDSSALNVLPRLNRTTIFLVGWYYKPHFTKADSES